MNFLDQLSKLSLTKKLAILAVLVVLLGAGFWSLYYGPKSEELESLRQEYISLQKKKAEAEQRKATYDMDRRKRDELQRTYTDQIKALPPDAEISSFLNKINAQADLVGIKILAVTPQKEEASQYYAKIPVQLKLEGSYHQIAKFFYLVGNLDRIINIEDINFRVKKIDESDVVLTVSALATTFRSVQPGEAAGAKKGRKA